ncbi:MAG TPA: TRAP transporter small permease subunit [Stellaceae bacterium]|nr:TRAP transporter small permease subunit [Stellaceae bacterium]
MATTSAKDAGGRGALAAAMRVVLAALLFLAIADMLAGVLLRYVVTAITDYFDWPSVSFFWAEELGEFALAWLTLLGAAVAILERTHFALSVLTHRFPPHLQRAIERINYLLIAGFGGLAAFYGWKLVLLNRPLTSPGLEINLAWLYAAALAGGLLMVFYGLALATGFLHARQSLDEAQ